MKPSQTIYEIRRTNLKLLIDESEERTTAAIALKCNTPPSYLSQILIRYEMPNGKIRELGSVLARKIEQGCNKSEGWMDVEHENIDPLESELISIFGDLNEEKRELLIQQARLMAQFKKG